MKKSISIVIVVCMLLSNMVFAASDDVDVTIPEFPVEFNGVTMNAAYSQYPLFIYDGITYFPMTYNATQGLGLMAAFTAEEGLSISQIEAYGDIEEYVTDTKNPSNLKASKPTFKIAVNGKILDNGKEQYPVLIYNDVTYFPLTWKWAHDEFNWDIQFDSGTGLKIKSSGTPVSLVKNSDSNEEEIPKDVPEEGFSEKDAYKFYSNKYTFEYLQTLVASTEADPDVQALIDDSTNAKYRKGMKKVETKYFDIYYPESHEERSQEYVRALSKYADTGYMFLTDIFGQQVPVEVHLVDEEDFMSSGASEGDIRRDAYITYVYMTQSRDNDNQGSAIIEMVHEVFHNFYLVKNLEMGSSYFEKYGSFTEEGLARMIAPVYAQNTVYKMEKASYVSNWNPDHYHNDVKMLKQVIDLREVDVLKSASVVQKQWGASTTEHRINRDVSILFWMYLYNNYGMDSIVQFLDTLDNDDYAGDIQSVYGENIFEEYNDFIRSK